MKQYNQTDRAAAIKARSAAVVFLREKGFTWLAIGYALKIGRCQAMMIHGKAMRQRITQQALSNKLTVAPPASVVAKFLVPKIDSKHTA
jgi:hypothetical protein